MVGAGDSIFDMPGQSLALGERLLVVAETTADGLGVYAIGADGSVELILPSFWQIEQIIPLALEYLGDRRDARPPAFDLEYGAWASEPADGGR